MMKYNISIFLFALIFFTGCSDEDESLTNSFHSTHAGTVWFSNSNNMWWRINMDSDDDYMNGKCTRYPVADGLYNSAQEGIQFQQTVLRDEPNFISWQLVYDSQSSTLNGTFTMSINPEGTKLTIKLTTGASFTYTKVTDTFPGTDCKPN
tara:strand:+ start:175 stop:624 length:450 start_codon:yes stop_codon:yes gene_type:complete